MPEIEFFFFDGGVSAEWGGLHRLHGFGWVLRYGGGAHRRRVTPVVVISGCLSFFISKS